MHGGNTADSMLHKPVTSEQFATRSSKERDLFPVSFRGSWCGMIYFDDLFTWISVAFLLFSLELYLQEGSTVWTSVAGILVVS